MRAFSPPYPYAAAGLSDEAAAAHALNRLGFGPRPGEVAAVARRGVEDWIAEQLGPPADDPDLDRRLADLDHTGLTERGYVETYFTDAQALQHAQFRGELPENTSIRDPGIRAQVREWMDRNGIRQRNLLRDGMVQAKLVRAVHARFQLREVLADFWYNHFNVDARGGGIVTVASYERDALRPHLTGRFRDLLGATARHPAMLAYLNNDLSRANEGSPVTWGQPIQRGGLNENYGRELLELHTLGVDGGYSQQDVIEVARAFTGWTLGPFRGSPESQQPQREGIERQISRGAPYVEEGVFLFRPTWHDAAPKTVLGRALPAGRGMEDGRDVLDVLAAHPATARHIARKLAIRFVADDPPTDLVDRLAGVFTRSDGDIGAVMSALVQDRAFWDAARSGPDGAPNKVKTPFEYVVSAARATAAPVTGLRGIAPALRAMGEPIYHAEPPTGFPDHAEAWVNAGLLLSRMNLGLRLAAGQILDAKPDLDALTDGREPESVDAALRTYVSALLPGRDPTPTVTLLTPIVREPAFAQRVAQASQPDDLGELDDDGVFAQTDGDNLDADDTAAFVVGVVLGSPSFQRQ